MSAHTRGPWEVWGDQVGHKHRKDKLGRPMRTAVAVVMLETRGHTYDESRAIRDADALLIAAAPMLHDALERLYVKLVKADWPDFDDEMNIAKAALLAAGKAPVSAYDSWKTAAPESGADDEPPRNGRGRARSLTARFWSKVKKADGADCWKWTAGTNDHGYGQLHVGETLIYAHRISFELHNGPIPSGLFVCHHCDNPPCCNPAHLFLGTVRDNVRDMWAKGRGPHNSIPGERQPQAKLTDRLVLEIRERAKSEAKRSLAREYGVSQKLVQMVVARQVWRHLP